MTKLALATLATLALTAISSLPAFAQSNELIITRYPGGQETPKSSTVTCGSQLGYLPRVYPADVAGIDNDLRVWVTPICEGSEFGMLRNEGNAAYLRPTIAQNDVLVDVLQQHDFRPDDVFAVRMMGDDTINLYVRHFR